MKTTAEGLGCAGRLRLNRTQHDRAGVIPAGASNTIGWTAIVLVALTSSCFAFWGVIEAFHEGWCKPTLGMRLAQLVAYLGPAIVMCALTVVGLRWPRVGATMYAVVGLTIAVLIIVDGASFGLFLTTILTVVPVLVGFLFLVGRPIPKRAAYVVSVGIPLLIVIGFGVEPLLRVSTRFDDGDRGERLVEGNGIRLLWRQRDLDGHGMDSVSWNEAAERARHLNEDGTALANERQYIWRLPSREEVVASLTRSNQNVGGTWDALNERPNYNRSPDKESPIWDPYASLIYLWTSEEESQARAWIVVYHGGVFPKAKAVGSPSFGFRAVRDVPR